VVCLKIIEVVPLYFPYIGGVSTHTKLLSEALAKEGVEVEVYTTDPRNLYNRKETINEVRIRRFPSFAPNDAYCFSMDLFNALRKVKADIIHAHSIHDLPLLLSAIAKSSNKIPLVYTFYYHGKGHTFFRNLLFQTYKHILGKYFLDKANLLICLSEYEEKMIKSDFKLNVKTIVIPACLRINSQYLKFKKHARSTKKILFVGRLEKYKGVQYLLYALKSLSKEIDVKLCIIGVGPYEEKLRKITEKLKISDRVTFLQKKGEEVTEEYLSSDVVVIPSLYESFNLVAIEALACGVPAITTPQGEAYTLIKEGLCLGLSDPRNVNDMCSKLNTVMSTKSNENEYKEISRRIYEKYSPQVIANQTISAYISLCTRK